MAEDTNVNQGALNGAGDIQNQNENPGEQQENNNESTKTYSQAELDKAVQAESDRRVNQALKAFKEKELPSLLEGAKTEAEKLARMTADQKAEHEKEKAEDEFAKREAELAKREFEATKRELKAQVIETFAEKNIPVYLSDIVNYTDAESCQVSIDAIEKAFRKAVEDGVSVRLKQNPPSASPPVKTDSFLSALKAQKV